MSLERRKRCSTKVVIEQRLDNLRKLMLHLPQSLPDPPISSYNFSPLTKEEIDEYGSEVVACTHRLEAEFGHLSLKGLHSVQLRERGKGPVAGVDFLETYYNKYPSDEMIHNWINGLLEHVSKISDAEVDESDTNDVGVKVMLP